jgi:hypothetical protein
MTKLPASVTSDIIATHRRREVYHPPNRNISRILQRRCNGEDPLLCKPFPTLFAVSSWWKKLTPVERTAAIITALARLHPDWIFCAQSAATILGLTESYFLQDGSVHIIETTPTRRNSTRWVRTHYMAPADLADIITFRGIKLTSPLRTAFDCSRTLSFQESLGIIDKILRLRWCKQAELLSYFQTQRTYRNFSRALIYASYGNSLSENGGESFARAQMIQLGFQVPHLQVNFLDPIRKRYSRVDYCWNTETDQIIWEFHGKQKYTDPKMTQGESIGEILSGEEKRAGRLSLHGISLNDFDFDDAQNPALMKQMLTEYGVPQRSGAHEGLLEFNRSVVCPRAHYPRSVHV